MNNVTRLTTLLAICFVFEKTSLLLAQETGKPAQEKSEMRTVRVLVLDPDGHPLDGATVTQSGLRTRVEPGSHWGWSVDYHGPPPEVVTNTEGIAEVPCPKYVQEKLETGAVTWSVSHPEFVAFRADRSVDDDPAEIRLQRGFRVAVTAVDGETGESVKTGLFAIISTGGSVDWNLHDNGMLVSPVFEEANSVMRVMQIVEGQPVLFSDRIEISPEGRSRVLLKDVKLSPGTRVEGRLADSVPRPVKNGHVTALIVRTPGSRVGFNRWGWFDQTPIAEDGTFVFESLPSDEVLQMIPVCDGWVPAKPSKESVLEFFPGELDNLNNGKSLPQLIALSRDTARPTLEMEPSGSVRITVLAPDGSPLPKARVMMWPNQLWFDTGSQILGDGFQTRQMLQVVRAGEVDKIKRLQRYSAQTDGQGIALIQNLPSNSSQSIRAVHEEFEMPVSGRDRSSSVNLKPGKVAEITFQLQKKGTEFLGAEKKDESGSDSKQGQDDGGESKQEQDGGGDSKQGQDGGGDSKQGQDGGGDSKQEQDGGGDSKQEQDGGGVKN